jgi:GR25 family glycosyltransferase involved in LPS biosynthesis
MEKLKSKIKSIVFFPFQNRDTSHQDFYLVSIQFLSLSELGCYASHPGVACSGYVSNVGDISSRLVL